MANVNLWSSVGSAGSVNPPDLGKVMLAGSVAQLGSAGGLIGGSAQEAAAARAVGVGGGGGIQAVIRYGVTAVDVGFNPIPNVGVGMVCRPGNGQIAARLVQVSIPSKPQAIMSETTVIALQSQAGDPNQFSAQTSSGNPGSLDFQANLYYVEVTLSAPGSVVATYPPAIATVQLFYSPPSGGGGGDGGGGGGGGGVSGSGGTGHQKQ